MPNRTGEHLRIIAYGVDPWIAAAAVRHPSCDKSLDALAEFGPRLPGTAWPMGLEISLQEKSFVGQPTPIGCPHLLNDFGIVYRPRKSVRLLRRYPPSELAAYYLFQNCRHLSLGALCKANALLGGAGSIRTHEHQSSRYPSSHRSVFLPKERVSAETEYLLYQINGNSDLGPFEFAVAAMIHLLVIHPFADANGRLSCLLFQYCLFKRGIIYYPLIPLNPFLELNRSAWLHALITSSVKRDLRPACRLLAVAVEATTKAITRVLDSDIYSIANGSPRRRPNDPSVQPQRATD